MARPRTESPETRRGRILDAARKVMVEKGYQDFRMGEVAEAAGVASGTLYLSFKDKTELFAEVFIDILDRLDRRSRAATKGLTGVKALKQMGREFLAFIDEHQDFLFQFTGEHPALSRSPAGKRLRDRYARHLETIAVHIKEAIREKTLRPHDPIFGSVHFSFLSRMFMIEKILRQSSRPLREEAPRFLDLYLRGMGFRGSSKP